MPDKPLSFAEKKAKMVGPPKGQLDKVAADMEPAGDPIEAALKAILAAKTPEEMKAHAQEALMAYQGEEDSEGEDNGAV